MQGGVTRVLAIAIPFSMAVDRRAIWPQWSGTCRLYSCIECRVAEWPTNLAGEKDTIL